MRRIPIIISLLLFSAGLLHAQEIEFGQYGSYTITLEVGTGDLNFGQVMTGLPGSPNIYTIELSEAAQVEIIGIRYLDVYVDITATDLELISGSCSGDCTIPFQLQAAYSNYGFDQNSIGNAQMIPITNNMGSIRFPILRRQMQPPGPPPAPPTEEFNQELHNETAVLYLYGSIEVGQVPGGEYSGTIEITISYE